MREPDGANDASTDGGRCPSPAEITVVRRIFSEFDAGATVFEIAMSLNADGVTSPERDR